MLEMYFWNLKFRENWILKIEAPEAYVWVKILKLKLKISHIEFFRRYFGLYISDGAKKIKFQVSEERKKIMSKLYSTISNFAHITLNFILCKFCTPPPLPL